jgi:PIN domain nuclease of toxin-antitoxin system
MAAAAGFTELAISADDAELAGGLDWDHRDPFDRMLVAQCRSRGLDLITADAAFRGLIEIQIVWAA